MNKINLQHFLTTTWTEIGKLQLKPGQQPVLAGCFRNPEDVCLVVRGNVCPLNNLKCDHGEADTRMMLHASNCSYQHPRVVVPSPDTDAELALCKCDKSSCKSSLRCLCRMNEMPCTEACGCITDENCQNPHDSDNGNDSSDDEI